MITIFIHLVFIHVIFKFVWIGESPIALLTHMRFLFHVNRHVTFHVTRLREAPIAHLAHVWFHIAVSEHVSLQMTDLQKIGTNLLNISNTTPQKLTRSSMGKDLVKYHPMRQT